MLFDACREGHIAAAHRRVGARISRHARHVVEQVAGAHALGATRASGDERGSILDDLLNDRFWQWFRPRLRCWRDRLNLDHDLRFRFWGRFNARRQPLSGAKNGVHVESAQALEAALIAGKRSDVINGHWCSVPGEAGQFRRGQNLFVDVEQVDGPTFAAMVEHVSERGSGHFRAKHNRQKVESTLTTRSGSSPRATSGRFSAPS